MRARHASCRAPASAGGAGLGARRRAPRPSISCSTSTSATATSTTARSSRERAQARRLHQPAGRGRGRQAVARRAARVLAERLQRARAADGRRSLSDSGTLGGVPGEEHPPDSRRVRAAARTASPAARVTLDQIEQTILPASTIRACTSRSAAAPSAAAGCAARRSPRARLEEQLAEVAAECVTRAQCVAIDRESGKVAASSIFSWREKEFAAAYADKAPAGVRRAQPDRARGHRLRHAEAAGDREGIPREEHVPGHLHAVRLDAERPHRPRRTMTSRLAACMRSCRSRSDRQSRHRHRLEPGPRARQRARAGRGRAAA